MNRAASLPAAPSLSATSGRVVDFLANQAAWWWCVLFARSGEIAASAALPVAYVATHVALARSERGRVAALALTGAVLGFAGDSLLAASGLIGFPTAAVDPALSSPFMVALWAMFAVSLRSSAAPLLKLGVLALAALGALAGPLAYFGGSRLGVLALGPGALAAVAVEWSLLVPTLAAVAQKLGERRSTA